MKLDPFYLIVDRASWLPRLLPQGVKLARNGDATAREVDALAAGETIE